MFFFESAFKNVTFGARSVEHAYLAILNDDLPAAKAVFESIDSPRARWGLVLAGIISGYMEFLPSYFEIRNFYEIDLDFLIKNEKTHYIEMLLSSLKYLEEINKEIYKYTARVMYENRLYNSAFEYMNKAKEIFYNDPELHFMLAKAYIDAKQFKMADSSLSECLKFVPSYFPALKMRREIADKF